MSTPGQPHKRNIYIHAGLEDQDDNLDTLQGYFKELQTMTVETSMNDDLDLLTFALSAHYFGVIMMDPPCKSSEDSGNNDGESEQQRGTSSGLSAESEPAIIDIPPPITEEQFLALSEKEKFERWVEAFQAKLKGDCGSDPDFNGPDGIRTRRFALPESPVVDKGKAKEPQSKPNGLDPTDVNDEYLDDLINWPEVAASDDGGPPSPPIGDDESYVSIDKDYPPIPTYNFSPFQDADDNFGREHLQSDKEPVESLPPIPQDPALQKFIWDSAVKFRDQLRARTVLMYEKRKAELARQSASVGGQTPVAVTPPAPVFPIPPWQKPPSSSLFWPTESKSVPIGIAYLTTSQNFSDPLHVGECNFGIYISPEHWNKGRVSEVIHTVIEDAFKDHNCHRLQAILVDHPDTFDYLNLYASAGFRHEGIRRRAFFSPISTEWKDVTYLAILATEWVHDKNTRSSRARLLPSSLWDEIISRHQREQEEFVRMEERKIRSNPSLKRTSSLDTIREVPTALSRESGAESTGFTTDTSTSSSVPSNKKRRVNAPCPAAGRGRRPSITSSESGFDSDWSEVPMLRDPKLPGLRMSDPAPSFSSTTKRSRKFGRNNSSASSSSWSEMTD